MKNNMVYIILHVTYQVSVGELGLIHFVNSNIYVSHTNANSCIASFCLELTKHNSSFFIAVLYSLFSSRDFAHIYY